MGRLSTSLLALVLGAACAAALVSCGGGDDANLLPGNTASEITANLDQVKELAQSGDCVGAQDAAQEVSIQIDSLGGVDKALKQNLREGATRLSSVVESCNPETTEAVAPASVPETTEDTSSETTDTQRKPPKTTPTTATNTTSTKTTTTTTNTTPTTPTTTPTTTTPPPTEGGGTGVPPGGVSPPGETEGGD